MKVIIQTASDRYIFPEAELVEIEHTQALRFSSDPDLPGVVITAEEQEEEER